RDDEQPRPILRPPPRALADRAHRRRHQRERSAGQARRVAMPYAHAAPRLRGEHEAAVDAANRVEPPLARIARRPAEKLDAPWDAAPEQLELEDGLSTHGRRT